MSSYMIALLPGDGIGTEITHEAVQLLQEVTRIHGGVDLHFDLVSASATQWLQCGVAMTDDQFSACSKADAMLMGAIGLPEARYPDGREVNGDVIFRLRFDLDLYAGIRPIRRFAGVPTPLLGEKPIDYVIVRENVEGVYSSRQGGVNLRDEVVTDAIVMTRKGVERVVEASVGLARRRNGRPSDGEKRLLCVDKANVLSSYAFFRKIFDEIVAPHPEITPDHAYIDAMCALQVLHPESLDVVVAENMFGDIISDLGAATVGGLGMAPSADVGDSMGLFQPSHGSAPDIAGSGIANPVAMILSAAMMLDWLSTTRNDPAAKEIADAIDAGVIRALASGDALTPDLGGTATTTEFAESVLRSVRTAV